MSDFLPFIVIGLTSGSVYGLAATGLVLTYRTSGIFNFAHGTIAAVVAFAFYDLRVRQGLPWPVAFILCVAVIAPLLGILLERMARRLSDAPVAMKVVATVGLLVAGQELILIRYGAAAMNMPSFLPTQTFKLLGVYVGYDQLIVMAVALVGMLGLTKLLSTRTGREMRAVVSQPDLLMLTGVSPPRVRRRAWIIGTAFAGLSGVLLAPTVGLDVTVLTLLVVQAFGAAAIGMFTSIPMTYVGGLALGVLTALSTKYVATVTWLKGVPSSLPFIILFVVLVVASNRRLVNFTSDRKPKSIERRPLSTATRVVAWVVAAAVMIWLPNLVGAYLSVYTAGLAYVLIFLSLALLMRTSGQVSLAQLSFAAVGAVASARLHVEAGVPWLVAVLLGAFLAVPVGAVLAIPAIRRSGLYLVLATFGFAVLLERLFYFTSLMFGGAQTSLPAPRPSFATGDRAYFYVVLAFAAAAVAFVAVLRRGRLGRLLRAMADSAVALDTSGMSVTTIKVAVFCIAAFLAGLGGALIGPVSGRIGPGDFNSFTSLVLVVVAAIVPGSEVIASIGAALLLMVLPSYETSAVVNNYTTAAFGVVAVCVAMASAGIQQPQWLARLAVKRRGRPPRNPLTARLEPG